MGETRNGIEVHAERWYAHACPADLAEGARFENSTAPETIVPDRTSSFHSQSLTEEPEAGEEPVKPDGTG